MRVRIKLDAATADDYADRARTACAYWASWEDVTDELPSPSRLRKALRTAVEVGPNELRRLADDDKWAVDMFVQLALFGELRYG